MLAMAMAARNSGGVVIAQAKRLAAANSLPARSVVVPGALVDLAYLDQDQTQTYITNYSPYYSGALRRPVTDAGDPLPLDVRKVIARRSLLEFRPGDICNLGFGISQMIGAVAWEEGIADRLVLTVEQGMFGGVPVAGNEGGAGFNFQAMIDQPYMFDFYDGGGLDIASLSFAQIDSSGNVNVHKFPGRLRGPGGFPNISSRTGRICFVGTLTTDGLKVEVAGGRIHIPSEGNLSKFVETVDEVSFSGAMANRRGQQIRYITERAVFELGDGKVTLIEVADGLDPENDVIAHMGFKPEISDDLGTMDPRVFAEGPMGLASDFGVAG
jgi:propionate CoA-transferase